MSARSMPRAHGSVILDISQEDLCTELTEAMCNGRFEGMRVALVKTRGDRVHILLHKKVEPAVSVARPREGSAE